MQEFLWEIWTGKQNTHHRVQMDASETPRATLQRHIQQVKGSDKEVPSTRRDPNTGQLTEIKWKYSFRSGGQESPLHDHRSFAEQGVTPDSLIVVREVELRAHTIYIDGFDGLGQEEMAAAKPKGPLIFGILFALLIGGGGGFYFFYWAPKQKALAPYLVNVMTQPEGAKLKLFMKVPNQPKAGPPAIRPAANKDKTKGKDEIDEKLTTLSFITPAKNVKIPKKAQIIFISITKKGYKEWTAGHPLDKWNKDQLGKKMLVAVEPKELTAKNYFPDKLEKLPPPPTFPTVNPPTPKMVDVTYPRRWRRFKLGIDPKHGGLDHQGVRGISGKTAGDLNLAISKVLTAHLKKTQRRRFRVYPTRTKDDVTSDKKRTKLLRRRRVQAVVQLDFLSGIKELPKASKTFKKEAKIIPYNDSVGGFRVAWSSDNKKAKASAKLAGCMSNAMKQAGFTPRKARKGEAADVTQTGITSSAITDPVLNGRAPAIRLMPGYLSHRGEDAVLNKADTHKAIARAIEAAIVCYKKR